MITTMAVALLSLVAPDAVAAPAVDRPVWLGATATGGASLGSESSGGGGFAGLIGVSLGKAPARSFGLEARVGEAVYAADLRTVGTVDFDVRFPAGSGPFAFVGFAHNHELAIEESLEHIGGAVTATYTGITHRTGFELGGGWDVAPLFPDSKFGSRVRPSVRLGLTVLPDSVSPPIYLTATAGVLVGIGKGR